MKIRILLTLASIIILSLPILAGMTSENYSISTSVLSGGGAPMTSDRYQTSGTLGQSSPLMDPGDSPYSSSYELFPAFWYTVEAAFPLPECLWDIEPPDGDGDVDGSDLAAFVADSFDEDDLAAFAPEFGSIDCWE